MRIGVNARTFSISEPEGEVQCALRLTNSLARLPDIELVLFSHGPEVPDVPDAEVVQGPFPNSQIAGLIWEQVWLPKQVESSAVDVLFCPTSNAPMTTVSVPVVTWIHDIFGYLGYVSRGYSALQRFRLPRIVSNTDYIATVSDYSRQQIGSQFDIPMERIEVVHNGIDDDFFRDCAGGSLDFPERYILYVGGLHGRKNIKGVIEAFKRVRAHYGLDIDLVLIGPEEKPYYLSLDVDIPDEHVHRYGFVPKQELIHAYDEASIFVFPSLYEGFGVPPLEAMARGTPVVSSNRASLPEVLDGCALLVNPDDSNAIAEAIHRVMTDPKLANALSETGREHANNFRWKDATRKMAKLLRRASSKEP